MKYVLFLATVLAAVFASASPIVLPSSTEGKLRLFVAYCPTDFTGEGAIVDVDPLTLNWTSAVKVKFPSEVFGCIADYNPKYDFDPKDPNTLWFDFTSDTGFFLAIDTRFGNTTHITSSSLFFTGFLNFKYDARTKTLNGLSGTVTQSGICSDACLGWGFQGASSAGYKRKSIVPFKEVADDTSYVNWNTNTFYFQASYDLRAQTCGPHSSSQCLLALDMASGELLNSTYTPQYQVYKFGRNHNGGNVSAFMIGFNEFCTGADNSSSYVFGKVNLDSAVGYPIGCIPPSVILQEDEWIASFSMDETLLATGSGNGDGDDPQLIVFETASGKVVKQSQLSGLAKALHGKMGLVFLWALEFVQGSQPTD
jgi:hypothetical protein